MEGNEPPKPPYRAAHAEGAEASLPATKAQLQEIADALTLRTSIHREINAARVCWFVDSSGLGVTVVDYDVNDPHHETQATISIGNPRAYNVTTAGIVERGEVDKYEVVKTDSGPDIRRAPIGEAHDESELRSLTYSEAVDLLREVTEMRRANSSFEPLPEGEW